MDRSKLLSIAGSILWVGAFGLVWHFLFYKPEPEPNFKCAFVVQPNTAPVRFGAIQGPISKIGIGGYLNHPFEQKLYDFEGRAKFEAEGVVRSYYARGSVFIWKTGEVGDLLITLEPDKYSDELLTLITFDKNGSLSDQPDVAYAFKDPNFKLSHPMKYHCSFIGPLPEAEDNQ